jgi:hypothetical protein
MSITIMDRLLSGNFGEAAPGTRLEYGTQARDADEGAAFGSCGLR